MSESKPKRRAGFDDLDMTDIAATPMRRRTDNLPWALEQIQQQASVISAHAQRLDDHADKLRGQDQTISLLASVAHRAAQDVKTMQDAFGFHLRDVGDMKVDIAALKGQGDKILTILENIERTAPRTAIPPMAPPMIYAAREDTISKKMKEEFLDKQATKRVFGRIGLALEWLLKRKYILGLLISAIAVWINNLSLTVHDKLSAIWQIITGR